MKESIRTIIQKIKSDAESYGDECYTQIKDDIDREISNENEAYREELDKRREMFIKHNEQEYAHQMERLENRMNREIIIYQHELIGEIFDATVKKLRNASAEEFFNMLKSAVGKLSGKYDLILGEFSKGKIDAEKIQEAIKNSSIDVILRGEVVPHKSGFVLKNDRVEYNCLFEDLIEDKKSEQTAEILKEVFEN